MASAFLRLVRPTRACRSAAEIIIFRTRLLFNSQVCCSKLRGGRMLHTAGSAPPRMSPWLMLPPLVEVGGCNMVYKFYSLAEKKVLSMKKKIPQSEAYWNSPPHDAEWVGSSHGWIALFCRRSNVLFLTNPLTRRHIKLPSIYTLPDPEMNARLGRPNVSKVVLSSSSPDEDEECRAVMTYGPANRLAFCSPAICAADIDDLGDHWWTPIGEPFTFPNFDLEDEELVRDKVEWADVQEDLVYHESKSERRRLFITIEPCELDLNTFQTLGAAFSASSCCSLPRWNPWSPSEADWTVGVVGVDYFQSTSATTTQDWVKKNKALLQDQCVQIPHIVHDSESDHLYIALRFVMLINPDDGGPFHRLPLCPYRGLRGYFASKTVGFLVFKVNYGAGAHSPQMEIVDDLNGLAMFVGINHAFVLPASDFPELKPDSIYFTDSKRIERIYGRNDVGIFDYTNKTVSDDGIVTSIFDDDSDDPIVTSSFGDRDDPHTRSPVIKPSPMWFTPCAPVHMMNDEIIPDF